MEKKAWQSKTLWISLITAAAAFVPMVSTWIAANPETFASVMAGVFMTLRFISKEKIVIS